MNNKLYVGNVSFGMSEGDLERIFGEFGTVKSVKIITDRETGRSRGFAFVEMDNEDEANDSISGLDGKDMEGRPLRVSIAKEREPRSGGGGGGFRSGGGGHRSGGGGGNRGRNFNS